LRDEELDFTILEPTFQVDASREKEEELFSQADIKDATPPTFTDEQATSPAYRRATPGRC
jgi:hypothetical protein